MSLHIEPTGFCTFQSHAIDNRTCRRAIAIDAIRPGTQHADVLARDLLRAVQRELLIASASAAVLDMYCDLSPTQQAGAFVALPKFPQAGEQVIDGAGVIPAVARVVDLDCKALALRLCFCCLQQSGVRKDCPPARSDKGGVVRLGGFLESVPVEEFAD